MSAAIAQFRATTIELVRYPSFSIPALLFPTALFLLFGRMRPQPADTRMASFAAVAILGVVFFQFGVGIAADRVSAWETYLRTLPVRPQVRIAVRVASGLVFAVSAAGVVVAAAVATTPVSLSLGRCVALASALVGGAIPFGLFGIALGYLARPRAALPVANLLYLPLTFIGGLWGAPRPGFGGAAVLIPTRDWASLLWAAVGAVPFDWTAVAALFAWCTAFAAVAVAAYRRDEGERFS